MTQKRRTFTAVEKAAAVREHLLDKIPVSQFASRETWSDSFPTESYSVR